MQEIADSFCERCGTRYTFSSAPPKGSTLAGARLLARGLKNFVMTDGTSLDEAMEAARIDSGHDEATRVAEEFHKTFNFCMSCRQYACDKCWNENQAACLSCAPLWDTPPVVPQDRLIMRMPVSRLSQGGQGPDQVESPSEGSDGHGRTTIEWPAVDLQPGPSSDDRATALRPSSQPPVPPAAPFAAGPQGPGDGPAAESESAKPWPGRESWPAPEFPLETHTADEKPAPQDEAPSLPAETTPGSPAEFRTPSWVTQKEEAASDELQARSQAWKSNDDGWSLWPAGEGPRSAGIPRGAAADRGARPAGLEDEWLGRVPGRGEGERPDGWLGAEPSMPGLEPAAPAPIEHDTTAGETFTEPEAIAPPNEAGSSLTLTAEELASVEAGLGQRPASPQPEETAGSVVEPAAVAGPDEERAQEGAAGAAAMPAELETATETDLRLRFLPPHQGVNGVEKAAPPESAAPTAAQPDVEPATAEETEDVRRQPLMARLLGRHQRPETQEPTATAPGMAGALPELPAVPGSELPAGQWPRPTRWLDRPVEHHDWWVDEADTTSREPEEIQPERAPSAEVAEPRVSEFEAAPAEVAAPETANVAPEPAPEPAALEAPEPEPASAAAEPASPAPKQGELFAMPGATTDRWPAARPDVPARAPVQWPASDLPDWAVAARLRAGSLEPTPQPEPAAPEWPPLGATWPARDSQSSPWQMPPGSAPRPRALAAHRADQAEIAESPLVAALWEESSQQVIDQGNVRVCRNCALPVSTHARFCRRCGTKQE
jgi:hypothetical protein